MATIIPLLEKRLIYDCYACRVGKGTHFAIVELIAKTIRSHWAIENNMHWELDTVMKEDECAFTNKTAALNWSILSKVSLSFLRRTSSFWEILPHPRKD